MSGRTARVAGAALELTLTLAAIWALAEDSPGTAHGLPGPAAILAGAVVAAALARVSGGGERGAA